MKLQRIFQDERGQWVRADIEIADHDSAVFEREMRRLVNKAAHLKSKTATSGGGVICLRITMMGGV